MYKWRPSKTKISEFKAKMDEINEFCLEHGIIQSSNSDSFYFNLNGKKYRVSNHTIETSNKAAYDEFGNKIRDKYHSDKRDENVIYIHASKTRIIEIYNNIKEGYKIDGRGYKK